MECGPWVACGSLKWPCYGVRMAQESPHECDTSRAAEIDRRLVALGRGVGGLRLRIGEALERFANRGGPATFGFSSIAAYAVERLGRSGHWAADARSLARRLAELPRLRAALVAGTLGTSMVELLARHAMPLTEADLIEEARAPGMTVRAMRARLAKDERMATVAEPERATVVVIDCGGVARRALRLGCGDARMGDAACGPRLGIGWVGEPDVRGHLYRRLGYASFEQYARERIGLSPSALEARFTLARRAEAMPELGAAIASGRIGFEAASLVARVARGTSVSAWIAQAEMRAVKHLREEVDAATMIARVSGCRAVMGHRKVAPEESFVWFLCAAVERAWRGAHAGKVAYQDVYLCDRFRCANPTCSRRDVTPHHIVFRSHGGGEERSNLVSLCTVCHLSLVHGGRIKVTGQGPGALKWRIGDDVVVVDGRRVVARVGAGCGR